jgi:hypothetical protein
MIGGSCGAGFSLNTKLTKGTDFQIARHSFVFRWRAIVVLTGACQSDQALFSSPTREGASTFAHAVAHTWR